MFDRELCVASPTCLSRAEVTSIYHVLYCWNKSKIRRDPKLQRHAGVALRFLNCESPGSFMKLIERVTDFGEIKVDPKQFSLRRFISDSLLER